ncbi:NERD domain-containing protein [Actinopolymorpha sp. NPDC004070]|uniref:NERD domain-containing protein n=1 Tax=Actinopolymorpha sp. NPDC004070 TaxID=3154548 RepID=UPI0033A6970B
MILSPDLKSILQVAESDAEKTVARLLLEVTGDPNAVAFHSVKLRSHRHKQQAEADFIVLWKGVVVVFEVKGGGIRCLEGRWWTKNRRQEWFQLKEPPMDQANGAKMALRDILKADGLGWYPDQHAVITPDTDDLNRAIGWYPSHWLASSDMTVEGVAGALDEIVRRAPTPSHGTKVARLADIRTRLYGEFTRLPAIDAQRGAVLEEQNRATAGQAKYLEGLARSPRVLVLGGAGTGKSLALAEGAKQEADQGRSVLITFGSPGLIRFFKTLVAGRAIDVIPFAELSGERTYEAVFVDEAQDLMTAEDMDKLDTVIDGGRANGRWRMFLDPNNQARVDGAFDEDIFALILEDAVEFELPMNVRNTKPIVHVVQSYLGADVGDPGIVHGEPLHWADATGVADVATAVKIADQLVADGSRPSSIWIIDASSSAAPVSTKRGVMITSPKHAKGLEADRVVVCNLPEVFDHGGSAAFYVAATRARVGLHILVSAADRKRLQELLQNNMGAL